MRRVITKSHSITVIADPRGRSGVCPRSNASTIRVNDDFPAGTITLSGDFAKLHRGEILHIVRRQEANEKPEHPFNRIMKISDEMDQIVVTTTDIHLLRRIDEALKSAFDGEVTFDYDQDGYFLRAEWRRDD